MDDIKSEEPSAAAGAGGDTAADKPAGKATPPSPNLTSVGPESEVRGGPEAPAEAPEE